MCPKAEVPGVLAAEVVSTKTSLRVFVEGVG